MKDLRDKMVNAGDKLLLPGMLLIVLFIFIGKQCSDSNPIEKEVLKTEKVSHLDLPVRERIMYYLIKHEVKHPRIVFAQCLYETGHLKSVIFKENNNLFGMKKSYHRPSTSNGVNRGHARYLDLEDSVKDYKIYQDKYYHGGDYYTFLAGSGYSTNKSYCKTLRNIRL